MLVDLRTVEQADDVYQSGMTFLRQHLHLTRISARWVEYGEVDSSSVRQYGMSQQHVFVCAGTASFNGWQNQKCISQSIQECMAM